MSKVFYSALALVGVALVLILGLSLLYGFFAVLFGMIWPLLELFGAVLLFVYFVVKNAVLLGLNLLGLVVALLLCMYIYKLWYEKTQR